MGEGKIPTLGDLYLFKGGGQGWRFSKHPKTEYEDELPQGTRTKMPISNLH